MSNNWIHNYKIKNIQKLGKIIYNIQLRGNILRLYHSTRVKSKIISENKLKINTSFNYTKYLEHLLTVSYKMEEPIQIVGSYPGAPRQAPFMGHGIYCYDNYLDAEKHQSKSEVLIINYSEIYSELDLDSHLQLKDLMEKLLDIAENDIEKLPDNNSKSGWRSLIYLLIVCVYKEFEQCQVSVGIILFILTYFKKINKYDVVNRSFYDIIGIQGDSKQKKKHILVLNTNKITGLS